MNGSDDLGKNATKGDILRLYDKIDACLRDIKSDTDKRIDEKIDLHMAKCPATDLIGVMSDDNKMNFIGRMKAQPEIPAILTILTAILLEMFGGRVL